MDLIRLDVEEEIFNTLPDRAKSFLFNPKYTSEFYGFKINNKIAAYVMLIYSNGVSKEMGLGFEYVAPEYPRDIMLQEMMAALKKILESQYMPFLYSKRVMEWEDALEYEHMMELQGFIPVNITGRLLTYNLNEMLSTGAVDVIKRNMSKFKGICCYEDVKGSVLKDLKTSKKKTNFVFDRYGTSNDFSRFYVENNEIAAAIMIDEINEKYVYVSGIYLGENESKIMYFMPMFVSALTEIINKKGTDVKVVLFVESEKILNGLQQFFTAPEEDHLVMEHIIPIQKGM